MENKKAANNCLCTKYAECSLRKSSRQESSCVAFLAGCMVVQISREGWGIRRALGNRQSVQIVIVSVKEQFFNSWKVIGTVVDVAAQKEKRMCIVYGF